MWSNIMKTFACYLMHSPCDQVQSVSDFFLPSLNECKHVFHTLSFGCDLVFCLHGKGLDSKKCFFRELQWLELCWAWIGNPLMNFPSSSWLFNKLPIFKLRAPLEIVLKEWACWALDVDSSKACFSQLLLYRLCLRTISVWEVDKYFLVGFFLLLKGEL